MSQARKQRRKNLKGTITRLESLIAERNALAESFLEGVDVTEEMVALLDKGEFSDKVFQRRWTRFQKFQSEIQVLRGMGSKLIEFRENNRKTGGQFGEDIKKEYAKQLHK